MHAEHGIDALCDSQIVNCMGGPGMIICDPVGGITMKGSWSWALLDCSVNDADARDQCAATYPECAKEGCVGWTLSDFEQRCTSGAGFGATTTATPATTKVPPTAAPQPSPAQPVASPVS